MRSRPSGIQVLVACALTALAFGCKVTAEDIETWKGTVKGPGKIKAVLLSESYPMELRTQAAVALVEMEPRQSPEPVDGIAELQEAIGQLDDETKRQIIDGMVPQLEELMRGGDTAETDGGGSGPPDLQVRAKDAAYLLIASAEGQSRERLVNAVVGWYVADFNGRNLAGNYSAEQIIRSLGTPAAGMLVDALNPQMPQPALIKLAELISQLGDEETKERAATVLVEIEQHMEGDEFLEWLKGKVVDAIHAQDPDAEVDQERVAAVANLNRENFINDGALPAMKHLATQDVVRERLLAIASMESEKTGPMATRRQRALQAMEGNAAEAHLDRLMALALSEDSPIGVRDYAFDRVGDIRSARAIPQLWPLVADGSDDNQRIRWRAAEMILQIGGPEVVGEFFAKLPTEEGTKYEPEELEGYATRISQMNPPPSRVVRAQLNSPQWFDRVIALRYFERKGSRRDIRSMRRLRRDDAAVVGEAWEELEIEDVGDVAEKAIEGLNERLSAGEEGENAEESAEDGGSE